MEFPNNFFQDEWRCDFKVCELMKRAWAAELEVLQVVAGICTKYGLPYFADSGTLLGAVRHQGFIPWDDDIDISLKRADYNRLIEVLPDSLPDGFVLSGMYAREKRLRDAAQVQHLRVIADENYWNLFTYMKRFHCFPYPRIGIDIFPLDAVAADSASLYLQKSMVELTMNLLTHWDDYAGQNMTESLITRIETLCNVKLARNKDIRHTLWMLTDSLCSLYREEECDELVNYPFFITGDCKPMKKEWFDDVLYLPFEHTTIAVPKEYDKVLTALYGDYMTPVQGIAAHDYPFYDIQEAELQSIFEQEGITCTITEFCRKVSVLFDYL